MLRLVAVGEYRQGVPKIFRAPMCRAHCAVIFAIAQLSCTFVCPCVCAQMADHYTALNANCSSMVKGTDFKYDEHLLRDNQDMIIYKISKKRGQTR